MKNLLYLHEIFYLVECELSDWQNLKSACNQVYLIASTTKIFVWQLKISIACSIVFILQTFRQNAFFFKIF